MKKFAIFCLVTAIVASSGCLKDKDFEDQQYGIDIAVFDAVAFPQASKSPVTVGITGQAEDLEVTGPLLTIESDKAPSADVHIVLAYDQSLVSAEGLEPLPDGSFSLNTLNVTIPAGTTAFGDLKLNLKNTNTLDPNIKYGIGFNIVSVDQGYQLAANSKSMVIAFSIKNVFDGVYTLKIHTTGWAAYGIADGPASYDYPEEYEMITSGANSVVGNSTYAGDNLLPAITATGGGTAFGATTPEFIFDLATYKLIQVRNTTPDDGRGRTLEVNPAITDSRYDPATKSIYAAFIMKQNGRPSQFFYDTLTYVKVRK